MNHSDCSAMQCYKPAVGRCAKLVAIVMYLIKVKIDNTCNPSTCSIHALNPSNYYCYIYIHTVPPAVSLPATVNATQGTTVTLDCDSSGIPQPNIFWYKDDNLLSSGGRLTIEEDVLTIENAFTTDSGEYTCKAVSVVDTVSASTLLDVRSE